jgi:hypothetical protein
MLTSETRPSGLIVARDSMDEESVGRALKRLDGRLVLQKHARDEVEGGWVYKVICFVSDTYAPIVLTWSDEYGRPLPLSSGIIDKVQSLYLDARNKPISADEHNARLAAELERDRQANADAVIEDHRPYVERDRVSVSLSSTKKLPYWQREGRPKSGGSVG